MSDDEEDSSEDSGDEENLMTRQHPQYRAQLEREKQARRTVREAGS